MEKVSERLLLALMAVWVARVTGDCGKPPILENGSPENPQTTSPVGTILAYKCFPGYTFQEGGSKHITCRENSTWSPLRAVCEPINCGSPGEILNGYFDAPDSTFGNKVIFYCDKGFNLVGKNSRICTANGWSGQVPTCEIVQCPEPPRISDGTVSSSDSDSWPFGSIARYSCLDGYSLIGEETITCTVSGEWDKDPPRCQALNCGNPGEILNGYYNASSGTTFGSKVVFYCDEGFRIVGTYFRICTADGWSGSVPTCKIVKCPEPPRISNGTVSSSANDSWPFGTKARYSCHDGYTLIGEEIITCTATGEWDKDPPRCQALNCGNPGKILNGYYTTFGSKVVFFCDKGFRIIGTNFRICTADGWSGQVPTCETVKCPEPPHISNGTVSPSDSHSWPFGSIARYSCLDGYSLIGEETINCTATGEWNKDPPTCKVVRCDRPPVPTNGRMVGGFQDTYTYLDTITCKCNEGFTMVGSSVIECRENNTFVPPPPICELSSSLVTTLATTHTGGCERPIGQQLGLLLILGVSAAFLT
ncbi:sushi, von Willebrand factor type A, EGF and pentraxin domain-containing protein 1-like [Hemiscyllium ocellatum]|uniref:sushi, von Willebrand factor type A, EGF and pentraxin domain-containing protein 1-like n=1 Tax=Hemiscyllium ocellatum TaxID=170820 RepID=UPI002966FA2F|nr:sushi, von Willebrand factor type A, EGF and pentraxin domain-containing protein 1-like [Hemiscyllium ocellatum]